MARLEPREIQQLERLCVQDDAPFCEAACPLHVNVKKMLEAVARGDFKAAAAVYQAAVPFPAILAYICDEPCKPFCKRTERGGALELHLLERTIATEAGFASGQPPLTPSTGKSIAVVGAGLAGLTATLTLAGYGHRVKLIEDAESLGGTLRTISARLLPPAVLEQELEVLRRYSNVKIATSTRLGLDLTLADLIATHDAVCLCVGEMKDTPDAYHGPIDPVTLATTTDRVFCAGALYRQTRAYSPVFSIFEGRKAAVSVDRLLRGQSLTFNREKEGPYRTRLYTSVKDVSNQPPVTPDEAQLHYRPEQAVAEAQRCLGCECLECVKACEYLDYFREYPGKCIRKVTKNIISVPGKSFRTFTGFINTCSLCGLCGVICPTDLNMAVVNGEARRIMWEQKLMPPAIHDFAIQDMESSNSAPYVLCRNQPGWEHSAFVFFPGCQLAASLPDTVAATYRLLMKELDGGVGLMTGCCGAPAVWAGRTDLFERTLAGFLERRQSLGCPRVITACPTCTLMLRESCPGMQVITLWEILEGINLPQRTLAKRSGPLAMHDPCSARTDRRAQDAARQVATLLGWQVEELVYTREFTKCCSYGGLMNHVNPTVAEKVVVSRIEESATPYVTYCANCRDLFAGKGKECFHLLELVFGAEGKPDGNHPGPTYSERRWNRRRLAERLLAELWEEKMPDLEPHCRLVIHMPEEIGRKLEAESILVEDVQRVIYQAETSGRKLICPATGHLIAHHRQSLVTYWVEYAPSADGYKLFNAYSHRMQIVEENQR